MRSHFKDPVYLMGTLVNLEMTQPDIHSSLSSEASDIIVLIPYTGISFVLIRSNNNEECSSKPKYFPVDHYFFYDNVANTCMHADTTNNSLINYCNLT